MSGKLPLALIRLDDGIQPRGELSKEVIGDYTLAMTEGAVFPPVTVFFDGETHWLAGGFHRCHAARAAGLEEIEAEIREGECRDAILHAVGANTTHGMRRTNKDKRRSVRLLLDDAEWSERSDREVARRCGVDHVFVGKQRPPVPASSGDGHQMPPSRKATRGGTTYTMTPRARAAPEPGGKQSAPLPARQPREPTIDEQHEDLMVQMLHLLRNISDVAKQIEPEVLFNKTPVNLHNNYEQTLERAVQFVAQLDVEWLLRAGGSKAEVQRAAQFFSDLAKRLEADQGAAEIHAVSEGRR